ncbi:MAG: hypothetical protein Q8T13_23025 [Acidobacteriota bacterium]|nr:hypothetical protein [Acidobacteriota bacterium]
MHLRGVSEAAAVGLAAILLACVFTYPYALDLSSGGRIDTNDGRWSIWVVTWVAHALTSNPLGVYQANIFHPHQNALAFSEGNLVGGVMGIPAWLLTHNPYVTHNFMFILSFVVSTIATYYLVRHLTGDRRAAAVAGLLFAYCPYVFARQAHSQLLLIGFIPWAMLAFHRFIDRRSVPRAIELGVVLWLTGLACAYYGLFAGGMVAAGSILLSITRGHWREPRYWMLVTLAAAVCVGLTTPLFVPYLEVQQEAGFARSLNDARAYSANLGAWLASSSWLHRWLVPYLQPPYMQSFSEVLFPGVLAVVLGGWGAWLGLRQSGAHSDVASGFSRTIPRDIIWMYVGIAGIAFWTAFGPKAGLYTLLYHTVPVFSFLRAPSRTGIVVTLCLVVLAAPALMKLMSGRRATLAFAALLLLATGDLYRAPLRTREAPPLPRVYKTLALLPRGPVIEFPFWADRPSYPRHAEYMLTSTAHWQPLINGYSDHIPQDFRDTAVPLNTFPSPEAFAILEPLGARYAVFHLNLMPRQVLAPLIERLEVTYRGYLRPIDKDGDAWLFEIVDWPR